MRSRVGWIGGGPSSWRSSSVESPYVKEAGPQFQCFSTFSRVTQCFSEVEKFAEHL